MARSSRGRGTGGGRQNDSRDTQISKALTYLLRHKATKESVKIDEGGWANLADVLAWRRCSGLSVTFPDIRRVVAEDNKQRFALKVDPNYHLQPTPGSLSGPVSARGQTSLPSDDPAAYLIRASQGHSLELNEEQIWECLSPSNPATPRWVVHGTNSHAWSNIKASGRLERRTRTMIHFATSVPRNLPPLDPNQPRKVALVDEDTQGATEVVLSGMRRDATVLVWVDVKRSALEGGIKWWRSANGVVLTSGVDGNLDLKWAGWVERRGTEEVLYGEKPPGGAAALGVELGDEEGRAVETGHENSVEELEKLEVSEGSSSHSADGEDESRVRDNWDD